MHQVFGSFWSDSHIWLFLQKNKIIISERRKAETDISFVLICEDLQEAMVLNQGRIHLLLFVDPVSISVDVSSWARMASSL